MNKTIEKLTTGPINIFWALFPFLILLEYGMFKADGIKRFVEVHLVLLIFILAIAWVMFFLLRYLEGTPSEKYQNKIDKD